MSDEQEMQAVPETAMMAITPLGMLQQAVTSGADISILERLMDLQERWQQNEARRAFTAALSRVRAEMPEIVKSRTVDFSSGKGRTNYKYEDLAEVIEAVSPVLSKHGLSFRWRTDSAGGKTVAVTCILEHSDGHAEETTLAGPIDESGNKNAVQAIGSAVTYLQRYTLKASLGIAAGTDDDGRQGAKDGDPPREEKKKQATVPTQKLATPEQRQRYQEQIRQALEYGIVTDAQVSTRVKWVEDAGLTSGMIGPKIAALKEMLDNSGRATELLELMDGIKVHTERMDEISQALMAVIDGKDKDANTTLDVAEVAIGSQLKIQASDTKTEKEHETATKKESASSDKQLLMHLKRSPLLKGGEIVQVDEAIQSGDKGVIEKMLQDVKTLIQERSNAQEAPETATGGTNGNGTGELPREAGEASEEDTY